MANPSKVKKPTRLITGVLTEVRKYPDVKLASVALYDVLDKLMLTPEERTEVIIEVLKNEPRLMPSGEVCRVEITWDKINQNGTVYVGRSLASEAIKNKYSAFVSYTGENGDKIKITHGGTLYVGRSFTNTAIENKHSLFVIFKKK